MDIFLIIFIVIIVFLIGFILSRPFVNADQQQGSSDIKAHYQQQYQACLEEISSIQEAYPEGDMGEETLTQIKAKKQEAARLLRLINNQK